MIKAGIYKVTNKINDKLYIGSSIDMKDRWSDHKIKLRKNKHSNIHLQNAWNKYGENNFDFQVIARCEDVNDLLFVEQFFLDQYFDDGKNCYNINSVAGSRLGLKNTKEQNEKISKSLIGNKNSLGNKPTKETMIKLKARKNHSMPHSQETKDKISNKLLGHTNNNPDLYKNKTWKLVDSKRVWMEK